MADALVSPAVGGLLWAASGGSIVYCARTLTQSRRHDLVPTMGVLGAFVFAAQMVNFAIPGTGSSGHLGGGLLLAILLGPHAALLVMASVVTIQAFFFADGGLLALGCNIWNLGVIPAFIGYPLIYLPLAGGRPTTTRATLAIGLAAVVGLQLGAMAVVLETWASGISALPLGPFLFMMLPIHLVIGGVEGLATAAVISFVARARPAALTLAPAGIRSSAGLGSVLAGLLMAAAVIGGGVSWFASSRPDGLEWAITRVAGPQGLANPSGEVHRGLAAVQEKAALLPGYGRPGEAPPGRAGASVSGLVGGTLALILACLVGILFRPHRPRDLRGNG